MVSIWACGEHRCGRAISEQTRADEHAGVFIAIERRTAHLHAHAQHAPAAAGGKQRLRGAEVWQRGAAALTDEVQSEHVAPQAQALTDVTGESRAEVAGACAHDHGINCAGVERAICQGASRSLRRQHRRVPGETRVQFIRATFEQFTD